MEHLLVAVVGDGDAVGIPPDIVEDLCRSGERPLRVDHPVDVPGRRQVTAECGGPMQVTVRGEEFQLAGGECFLHVAQEQPAGRRDSTWTGRKNPGRQVIQLFTVRRDPAARNQKMNLRIYAESCLVMSG